MIVILSEMKDLKRFFALKAQNGKNTMGKKDKKKLKKKLIKQRLAVLEQQGFIQETRTTTSSPQTKTKIKTEEKAEEKGQDFIKKDLRKVGFIIIVLAVIFTALLVLKVKTGYISKTGDWLFSVLNIG